MVNEFNAVVLKKLLFGTYPIACESNNNTMDSGLAFCLANPNKRPMSKLNFNIFLLKKKLP